MDAYSVVELVMPLESSAFFDSVTFRGSDLSDFECGGKPRLELPQSFTPLERIVSEGVDEIKD